MFSAAVARVCSAVTDTITSLTALTNDVLSVVFKLVSTPSAAVARVCSFEIDNLFSFIAATKFDLVVVFKLVKNPSTNTALDISLFKLFVKAVLLFADNVISLFKSARKSTSIPFALDASVSIANLTSLIALTKDVLLEVFKLGNKPSTVVARVVSVLIKLVKFVSAFVALVVSLFIKV